MDDMSLRETFTPVLFAVILAFAILGGWAFIAWLLLSDDSKTKDDQDEE